MADQIPVYIHLLRAKDLIDREFARELDVPALARDGPRVAAHFSRGFKRAFGETPHQYLLKRRIERAMELLRETDRSVTEVSLDVGFQSLGSFSTAFRDSWERRRATTRGAGGRAGRPRYPPVTR